MRWLIRSMTSQNQSGSSGELVLSCGVAGILLAILFLRLDDSLLWDDDECRNARCSVEMLSAGDLVVPKFHGQLRTHKPVLLYWLMIPCMVVFGDSELAARLPSAMCGLGTVVCVWLSANRLYPRGTARFGALALGSSLLFVMASRAATPDSLLIFCLTASLSTYICGTWSTCPNLQSSGLRQEHTFAPTGCRDWIQIYGFMGLGVLAKGPVGVLLPLLIIAAFLCLAPIIGSPISQLSFRGFVAQLLHPRRVWGLLLMLRPMTGLITVSLVALPWYVSVTVATNGEWLRGFLLDHNVGRALQPMEGHSGNLLLFYPAALCVGFFPWSVLLTVIGIEFRRQRLRSPHETLPMLFGLCWALVPVCLFSMAATQLPSYITPGYPGLALVAAPVMHRLIHGRQLVSWVWLRLAFGTAATVSGVLIAAALIFAAEYLPGSEWLWLVPVPLLISSVLLCRGVGTRSQSWQASCWCFSAALFTAGIFLAGVPAASAQRGLTQLFAEHSQGGTTPIYASWGTPRASWVFYSRQNLPIFAAGTEAEAAEFLEKSSDHFLIVFGDTVESVRAKLPVSTRICGSVPAFPDAARGTICLLQCDRHGLHLHRKLMLSDRQERRN